MEFIARQFKQALLTIGLLLGVVTAFSQSHKKTKPHPVVSHLKEFVKLAAEANVIFTLPEGFKEAKAPDNDHYSFDYAITIPGKAFEIWFQVRSQKENYNSYIKSKEADGKRTANPDSIYLELGKANAMELSGDNNYFVRNMPERVLAQYNADAGKTFLFNLLDSELTRHYKYALVITLQKDHIGTILAVCITNDKGPDFFKNINMARNCIQFKD